MAMAADGTHVQKLHAHAVDEILTGLQLKGYKPTQKGLIEAIDLAMSRAQSPDALIAVKAVRDIRLAEIAEKLSAAAFKLILAGKTWPHQRSGRPHLVVVLASPSMTATVWAFIEKHVAEVIQPVFKALDLTLDYAAIDHRGLFQSSSALLEGMPIRPAEDLAGRPQAAPKVVDIFSGLGQWQLKILLGQRLPDHLITIPRGVIRNPTDLATLAVVSKANSYKLVSALKEDHFVTNDDGLRLVRVGDLLARWAPYGSRTSHETAVAPILPGSDPDKVLDGLLRKIAPLSDGPWHADRWVTPFRVAIAANAAADRLGVGHVRGVKPVLYMDRVTDETLRALGLRKVKPGAPSAYLVRRPKFPDAVFDAAVNVQGVPVTDIIQTWMDVQRAPRGDEQAAIIMERILADGLQ